MSFRIVSSDRCDRWKIRLVRPLPFADQSQQQVLGLDRDAAELTCLITGEEQHPPCSFGVPLEHPAAFAWRWSPGACRSSLYGIPPRPPAAEARRVPAALGRPAGYNRAGGSRVSEAIGFIGLGAMGRPMALNLRKHDVLVVVHNRSHAAERELAEAGAAVATTPAAVASACRSSSPCCLMRPMSPPCSTVPRACSRACSPARSWSTPAPSPRRPPSASRRSSPNAAAHYLDAPVSGGEIGAIDGTLTFMVGGDAEALARVTPLLAKMGRRRPDRARRPIGRRPDLQGLQPARHRRHDGGRGRGAGAGRQGRGRRRQGAPGAARRLCREPRARGARRADAHRQLQAGLQGPALQERPAASCTRRWPNTACRRPPPRWCSSSCTRRSPPAAAMTTTRASPRRSSASPACV